MCEIILFAVDITNPSDFYKDCGCYKSGFVIEVMPDGWGWTPTELSNPNWRIIKMPGIDPSQATQFLTPQIPADPTQTKTLMRRANKFDWTKIANTNWGQAHPNLVTAFLNYMNDSTRSQSSLTLPQATVAQIQNILATVATPTTQATDPAIQQIGGPTNTIGA